MAFYQTSQWLFRCVISQGHVAYPSSKRIAQIVLNQWPDSRSTRKCSFHLHHWGSSECSKLTSHIQDTYPKETWSKGWQRQRGSTTTTTTPSSMIPLTRGLERSECRQPYPCKYQIQIIYHMMCLFPLLLHPIMESMQIWHRRLTI